MKVYTSRKSEHGTLIELGTGWEFIQVCEDFLQLRNCYILMFTFIDGKKDITAYPYTWKGLSRAVNDFWFL